MHFKIILVKYGKIVLGSIIALFAYTSYLGYFVEYKTSITYLFGDKYFNILRWIYYVPVVFAVMVPIDAIWSIADISVGFIMIPNLIALVLLGKDFKKIVQEFKELLCCARSMHRHSVAVKRCFVKLSHKLPCLL